MKAIVKGQEPFKAVKNCFCVGPTTGGYTLSYSADKVHWADYSTAVPANETAMVLNVVPLVWFKLKNNSDNNVTVIL